MERIFITGSNRGIGLAVVQAYLQRGDVLIFAACRNPDHADELKQLLKSYPEQLRLIPLEVTEQASIDAAFQLVSSQTSALDIVINNAGVDPAQQSLESITAETMLEVYRINAVAPLMLSKAFLPLLKGGTRPRLVQISTEMASLQERTYGGSYAYCSSKAALNMLMRGLAADLSRTGIINIALDPGWARTDMGGSHASIAPETSAKGIVKVISQLQKSDNGRYLAYNGQEHKW